MPTQLIVFADDWGRHPSSSQHLIRELLPQYPTLWVNTVGTRRPRLSLSDMRRGTRIVASWFMPYRDDDERDWPAGLRVIAPKMYPGYRWKWQRRYNARQVGNAVSQSLLPDHRHVVITTLPTTADLVGKLAIDRWIYYCVDDYSKWPGTDHAVMDTMERELVSRVDTSAAVSEVLIQRLQRFGINAAMIDHGVALDHWATPDPKSKISMHWPDEAKPIALFWGLVDERLDYEWCSRLGYAGVMHVVYAGPIKKQIPLDIDAFLPGPIHFNDLPAYAAASNVLIMPYIDAPVTRAMQPLKLKEYLATMKPVVVRDLPSTREWADCCDLASSAQQFVALVKERAQTGTPASQLEARRRRLPGESWTAKAAQLAAVINAG